MADPRPSLYLTGLNEEAALELLRLALAQEGTSPRDCIWHIADRGPLGLGLSLALPEATAQACAEEIGASRPGLRLQGTPPDGSVFDCASGLLLLLQPRAGTGDWSAMEDEALIVCETSDADRVEALFREISFGATHTRVAAAQAPAADGSGTRTLWLFHAVDDQQRSSTLAGSKQSGTFADCTVLRGYQDEGQILFFPEEAPPRRERFRVLRQLVTEHPGLFGSALPKRGPVLAAIPGAAPSDPLSILWLGDLRFVSEVQVHPAGGTLPEVRQIPLTDAASELERLRLRIAQAGPEAGYPLRLAPAPIEQPGASERMRLRQRLAETRQRLAYLESLDQSHPILYRFAPEQLEQLAALLASFPVEVLKDGDLLYGFYADETQPAGCHFLLVEPEHAQLGLLGPEFSHHGNGADRFQIDPLWAGAYYTPERPSLVFVPFGQRLTPSMHAWNAAEMDTYLAESVATWMQAHGNIPEALPNRPLYLFDERTGAGGSTSAGRAAHTDHTPHPPLHVSVLDRDAFVPLHERMGWINENLLVTRDLGMQAYVSQLAEATSRESLLAQKQERVGQRLGEFERSLEVLSQQVLARARGFLKVLDDRVEKSVGQVETMRQELDGLETSLTKLQAARSEMKKDHNTTLRQVEADLMNLPAELRRVKRTMDKIIANAEIERQGMEGRMQTQVAELRTARQRLIETMKKELWLK